jgi:hypothetical protein
VRVPLAALLALCAACSGAQSEDARFRNALSQTPPMINPAVSGAADPAVSSSWDSTYRMLSFSSEEVCFLAKWDVPSSLAPSVTFELEGWRSLDEDRSAVPSVASTSMEIMDADEVTRLEANDAPAKDDVPPEIRAMRPTLTPMRVCFPPSVIRPETRYLFLHLAVDEANGRHHETGAGWHLVVRR